MMQMTMDIDFIFFDIDGTIFSNQRLVPSAVEAIQTLQSKNVPLALCTGRSALHSRPIQEHLGIQHAVYFNGGLVKAGHEIIYSTPLEPEVVKRIIAFSDEHNLPIILHTSEDAVVLQDIPSEFKPILDAFDFPEMKKVTREWLFQAKMDIYQVNMMMERSWEQLVENTIPEVLIYRWDDRVVDLQKRGCDKSQGASALLKHLRIERQNALHIGDGGNDIGMFQTMGLSVAMGNAPDDVKKYARMVTEDVDRDGVYLALKKLRLIDEK
jgi:Cof subfamily protein (haloacid dehalogenase superfamily)